MINNFQLKGLNPPYFFHCALSKVKFIDQVAARRLLSVAHYSLQLLMFALRTTILLFFVFNSPAYAYLDPGSVSLGLQAFFAAIAGAALFWRFWFWKVLGFFGIKKGEQRIEESESGVPEKNPDNE